MVSPSLWSWTSARRHVPPPPLRRFCESSMKSGVRALNAVPSIVTQFTLSWSSLTSPAMCFSLETRGQSIRWSCAELMRDLLNSQRWTICYRPSERAEHVNFPDSGGAFRRRGDGSSPRRSQAGRVVKAPPESVDVGPEFDGLWTRFRVPQGLEASQAIRGLVASEDARVERTDRHASDPVGLHS